MKLLRVLLSLVLLICSAGSARDLLVVTTDWASTHEQVLVVDPETNAVRTIWSTGWELDIGFSSDGRRLFVVYGPDGLAVVNLASGLITHQAHIEDPLRWILPSKPSLAVSFDGQWLYFFKAKFNSGGGPYDMSLAAFDARRGQFADTEALFPNCTGAELLPVSNGSVGVRCGEELRFFRFNRTGVAEEGEAIDLPKLTYTDAQGMRPFNLDDPFLEGEFDPAKRLLYFVSYTGRVVSLNIATREVVVGVQEPLLSDSKVQQSSATITPDGHLWYLPVCARACSGNTQILAIDLLTSQAARVITTSEPFWGLTMSSDGKTLYAGAADHHWIIIIDAVTGQQIRKIALPGKPAILTRISAD